MDPYHPHGRQVVFNLTLAVLGIWEVTKHCKGTKQSIRQFVSDSVYTRVQLKVKSLVWLMGRRTILGRPRSSGVYASKALMLGACKRCHLARPWYLESWIGSRFHCVYLTTLHIGPQYLKIFHGIKK